MEVVGRWFVGSGVYVGGCFCTVIFVCAYCYRQYLLPPANPQPQYCILLPTTTQWGEDDPWTPINGTVAAYFKNLAQQQPGRVQFVPLPGTGHCPQDDRPELVGKAMKAWLEESVFCDKVSATKEKQERGNVVRASGGKKEKQKERGNKKNKQGHTQLPT